MEKDLVGYRFCPTGEELINHYLKNKVLGKSWLVDAAISEINICNYEPLLLPSLSKLESKDPVWYFFSPKEYTTSKKKVTKRTTGSGYWKATGVDRKIKDKRGNHGEIGIKKTLVYYEGRVPNGVWTPWVMHEYHITCLPPHQRTYVICQVMYKGDDGDVLYGTNSSEPSHSLVEQPGQEDGLYMNDLLNQMNGPEDLSLCDGFDPDSFFNDNIPNVQQDDEFSRYMEFNGGNFGDVLSEWEMQENHNNHRPKKPLSGIIANYSSDTDSSAESIYAASYQGTSSPGDSVGSSNRHFPRCSSTDSCKDLQTSADSPLVSLKNRESQLIRRTIPSKQEVEEGRWKAVDATIDKESSMVKTEKKGWFITEEAMQRKGKSPRYIYLMNTIVGFTLLVTLIGNIMSVLLSVKT